MKDQKEVKDDHSKQQKDDHSKDHKNDHSKDHKDDNSKDHKNDHSKEHSKDSVSTPDKGNWSEQKAKLKAKYPTLTEADFVFAEGKKDEMLAKLQAKLGKTKEELTKIIATL
jgi:uncharacterized protein YjbJ (UPF0337 family)